MYYYLTDILKPLPSDFPPPHLSQMAGVKRDLWRSPSPTTLLKQGSLEQVAQNHVQIAFEYLQGWKLQNLPGQHVPMLSHPHTEKVFSDFRRIYSMFQFVFIVSGPGTE